MRQAPTRRVARSVSEWGEMQASPRSGSARSSSLPLEKARGGRIIASIPVAKTARADAEAPAALVRPESHPFSRRSAFVPPMGSPAAHAQEADQEAPENRLHADRGQRRARDDPAHGPRVVEVP